jgi:hypothetical protein
MAQSFTPANDYQEGGSVLSAEQTYDYWESCGAAFEAIICALPPDIQGKICAQLQARAVVQADNGELRASYFSRMLTGEEPPVAPQQQIKRRRDHLRLVKA